MSKPKVIVIVGPTGSGKTALAIELAQRFNGEVISADSRQVYRGLDIGSAKVTKAEMAGIPHHLLDVADPRATYNAADFKRDATAVMADIVHRGNVPIVCGGTFFYIDVLLGRTSLPEVEPNETLRAELENQPADELFDRLSQLDPARAATIEKDNPRRLIRAIEIATAIGQVPVPDTVETPYDILTIGLAVDMATHGDVLRQRLLERLDAGLVAEVDGLLQTGITHERLESFGLEYRYVSRYRRGLMTYEAMIDELSTKIRQFAKRQMTWLRRDDSIQWFNRQDQTITQAVARFLKQV